MTSPIFESRSNYKPFDYNWAFEAYDLQQRMHWLPYEVPLAEDVKDWNSRLTDEERQLLTQLFRFFTQADTDISEGYVTKYMPMFQKPELRMMLCAFAAAEANHMHSYSQLIDTLGLPEEEYIAFRAYKEMANKHDFMFENRTKGMPKERAAALDLAVFSAFGEGLQLFSTFAILMNFQRHGKMKSMSTIVEWSIRDENLHVESMIKLFRTVIEENPHIWTDHFKAQIYQACRDMVELEDAFIDLAFGVGGTENLSRDDVKTYIRYIADMRLEQLGLKPNYGVETNPLDWLDWIISAPTHANFFEQRSTEYGKGMPQDWPDAFAEMHKIAASGEQLPPIVIYTKPNCPWCAYAKALAQSSGIKYECQPYESYQRKDGETLTWPRIHWKGSASEHGALIGGSEELLNLLS